MSHTDLENLINEFAKTVVQQMNDQDKLNFWEDPEAWQDGLGLGQTRTNPYAKL